jgi:type 1 glutamine amidotransferase
MTFQQGRAGNRAFKIASILAAAAGAMIAGSASAQPAGQPLVNPPSVAISREPLATDVNSWVGCKRVTSPGPGVLCPPPIQTGTPAIQARLRAQRDAYAAANPSPAAAAPAAPQAPVACGVNPYAAAAAAGAAPAARRPQNGVGPIRVLFVTRGHEYEREQLAQMLDCLGDDISWAHVEYPAAEHMFTAEAAKNFDVYLFYDLGGWGTVQLGPNGERNRFYPDPSPGFKRDFQALVKQGKGMVFLHHASSAYAHTWPEYSEVVGGACDWYAPATVRGILDPRHGYYPNTPQRLTVADKNHPTARHLGDGFDVVDEAYSCAWFPESVKPILTTSFTPPDPLVNLNPRRSYSNLSAWYKASENSPVFFAQAGHNNSAWRVAEYQLLIRNAIRWAASPEALAWAKANRTQIFK